MHPCVVILKVSAHSPALLSSPQSWVLIFLRSVPGSDPDSCLQKRKQFRDSVLLLRPGHRRQSSVHLAFSAGSLRPPWKMPGFPKATMLWDPAERPRRNREVAWEPRCSAPRTGRLPITHGVCMTMTSGPPGHSSAQPLSLLPSHEQGSRDEQSPQTCAQTADS